MSEPFDPYLHWLGIRDPQRPPNHYRLLGVEMFESDSVVLANAADRQMAHVRTFQTGPRSAESQRLLNEIAAAKVCLLNPQKKEAYDARLRAEQQGYFFGTAPASATPRPAAVPATPQASPSGAAPNVPGGKAMLPNSLLISALAAAAVILVGLIVLFAGGGDKDKGDKAVVRGENTESETGPDRVGTPAAKPVNPDEKTNPQAKPAVGKPKPSPETTAKPDPGTKPEKPGGKVPHSQPQDPSGVEVAKTKPEREPGKEKPAVEKPDGSKPDGSKPDGSKPDAEKPEVQKPDTENPDLSNPPPLAESLAAARTAMRNRDPAAALQHLDLAEKRAFPKDKDEIVRLRGVAKLLEFFLKTARASITELNAGDQINAGGRQYKVVEASPESVTLAAGGEQRHYTPVTLPPAVIETLAGRKLPQFPASSLAVAAFHLCDPGGDLKQAAALIDKAAAQGLPVEALSAELKRAQAGGEKPAAAADGRLPIPDAAAQDAARKEVRDVLRDKYAAAVKPADKGILAQVLLRQGTETKDNPAVRYVLLTEARDTALAAGDAALLRRAVDEMAKSYQVDLLDELTRVLSGAAEGPMPAPVRKGLARAAVDLTNEALARDSFEQAVRLAKVAHSLASRAREGVTARQAADLAESIPWLKKQYELSQQAAKALAKDPENPKANLALGTYCGLIKNDWGRALPLLAKGSDPKLKTLAEAELALGGKAAPAEVVKLADQWLQAADSVDDSLRAGVRRRALTWYENALPHLSGFTKTRVDRVVQELKGDEPAPRRPAKTAP